MGRFLSVPVAVVVVAATLAFVTDAHSARAARPPTFKEREALTLALPAWLRRYPVGCVWLSMSVSSNGRYAIVAPEFLNATHSPCVKYASNGLSILKKSPSWKIIFNGSVEPPCSLGVPRDLTKCFGTRSCGFQSFGKGWYLSATHAVGCGYARTIFRGYFATRGCNGPTAGTCTVRAYRCRYDYRDDVERVSCTSTGGVIAFRSVA